MWTVLLYVVIGLVVYSLIGFLFLAVGNYYVPLDVEGNPQDLKNARMAIYAWPVVMILSIVFFILDRYHAFREKRKENNKAGPLSDLLLKLPTKEQRLERKKLKQEKEALAKAQKEADKINASGGVLGYGDEHGYDY